MQTVRVAGLACIAIVSALLASSALSGIASGVPLRPDVLERLRSERNAVPSVSQLATLGVDVPVEKFSQHLVRPLKEGVIGKHQIRALVILVQFSDLPAQSILHDRGYYDRLLFGEAFTQQRSQRDYYLENSYGKLDVIGDVVGWYTLPHTRNYYASWRAGLCDVCYPENARGLVEDALRLAAPDVDFSLYDNDGPDGIPSSGDDDGYIDALYIIHSGPGYEETGNPSYILSHQWMMEQPFNVDGSSVYVYSMEAEDSPIGTFCHELGHVLGLPDLYDRDYSSYGLDAWSLMSSGVWLGDGNTPSHLDAWSKVRLGFVEPVVLSDNKQAVEIPPVEAFPVIYKLWKNGNAGREYFLVENRENRGFDFLLPGSGLLVYHVDETVHNNDNELRYMVALEQADGDFDLERWVPNREFGADAGDPFPGWSNKTSFTQFTTPNSLSNDGDDVEVRLTGISLSESRIRLDTTVETGPEPVVTRVLTDDVGSGDGDGTPDAGETAKVYCEFDNIGLASGFLTAVASCSNIHVRLLSDTVTVGRLAADETRVPEEGFVFESDTLLPRDPYRVYFVIDISDGASFQREKTIVVGIGDSLGISDDFESGEGEWTHGGVKGIDDWHLSTGRAFSGATSWHCGRQDTLAYRDNQDSFLRTPFLISGAGSTLSFYQWLDVENENSRLAWDGCVVEASTDNETWEPIEPIGGYPYRIDSMTQTDGAGRGCFSGRSRQWERVQFDLGRFSGALWLRFRLISDAGISGEGWYIDDVQVKTEAAPYTIAFETIKADAERVTIDWTVTPRLSIYTGQGMSLLRETVDSGSGSAIGVGTSPGMSSGRDEAGIFADIPNAEIYELVYQDTSRSLGLRSFVDTSVVSGRYYLYLIRDVGADGRVTWIQGSRVYVPYSTHAVNLASCWPNPYVPARGTLNIVFEIPDGYTQPISENARVTVFDIAGRAIRVVSDGRASSGRHFVTWDGRDSQGRTVAAGIYFISLEAEGARFSRKVVVLR